jgi:hypothetical protein
MHPNTAVALIRIGLNKGMGIFHFVGPGKCRTVFPAAPAAFVAIGAKKSLNPPNRIGGAVL